MNKMLRKKAIDGAIISSIKSFNYNCLDLGIVANGEVYSVLLLQGQDTDDKESDTSNALKKVLNLHGKVCIGDKALKIFYKNKNHIDLSCEWYKKYKLPFVFARLCFHKNGKYYKKLQKDFLQTKVKIPYYYLKLYSKKKEIPISLINEYLSKISYSIGHKEKLSLKLFKKLSVGIA